MYTPNELKDNDNNSNNSSSNNVVIIREFRTGTRIHEHDFISVKTKKEQGPIIICCICGLVYCDKCGKLVIIYDKNYMQHNVYN
jgi:hypothetical protein